MQSSRDIADHLDSLCGTPRMREFRRLLDPIDRSGVAALARSAATVTRRHFGRTIRLFAPLYLSNECVNNCRYCGFSRDNLILRTTLSVNDVIRETRHLTTEGFRSILLVAGEHPRFVSGNYLAECVHAVRELAPSVALEVGPMETDEYVPLVDAGAEGLVVYQETYNRDVYHEMHTAGPKRDYDWRLACSERAYAAGFRRLGIGALLGLAPWRQEALMLASHAERLLAKCWKAQITLSLPRLRPAAGEFEPRYSISDLEFIQLVCALRLTFPEAGIVLSTRESPALREALLGCGITHMSAGSHTEPGGYTGVGAETLKLKARERAVESDTTGCQATGQFNIADERSALEVAQLLRARGFDPVWKDWDSALGQ
jgi:2-iminoacetate synthase